MKLNVLSPRSWVAALAMATLMPFAAPASAGLANGNFESTTVISGIDKPDGWTVIPSASLVLSGGIGDSNAVRFENVDSANGGSGLLSQKISFLGGEYGNYVLTFSLMGAVPPVLGEFMVTRDSVLIGLTAGSTVGEWTSYFSEEFYVGADFTLAFVVDTEGDVNLGLPGSGQAFNFALDNVVLAKRGNNDVPEPGSLLLVGVALAGVAVARRRKIV